MASVTGEDTNGLKPIACRETGERLAEFGLSDLSLANGNHGFKFLT
jgi:hypothetical protein